MAKNAAVPPSEDDLWPIVEGLRTHGGAMTIREMVDYLARAFVPADPRQQPPPEAIARTEARHRMAGARAYLKKAGVLENSRDGVWRLTPRGSSIAHAELASLPAKGLETVRASVRRRFRRAAREASAPDSPPAQEPADWVERLLGVLQALPPSAFERLCQRMLREKGFAKVEVTGKSGDGGIDGVGVLRLNLLSFPVLFQCKRYAGSVGCRVVRDFRGAMVGRADKGLIITTGSFTPEARREAVRDGAPAIDLIDGLALAHILKELRLGVGVTMVENVTILEVDLTSL